MADKTRLIEATLRATPARELLERALAVSAEPGGMPFRALFAGISRRLAGAANELVSAPSVYSSLARPHWTLTDWTRLLMLVRALEATSFAEQPALVLRTYEGGEIGEQESVLRALALLPDAARFVETGVAGCRTNAKRVFEAIACDNPFPAAHFPELNYNQLVMKALFIEAPVEHIEGLGERRTPELLRMAKDYASERRAAGRSIPADIELIFGVPA